MAYIRTLANFKTTTYITFELLAFEKETDHRPLVALFGTNTLDELTPRIQRIRIRMMKFLYEIHPGT